MKTLIIGIAGGTGSGKTTLAEKLARIFGNDVAIIKHDSYYKCQDGLSLADRAKQNYDHPNSFDTELMVEHIKKLKAGESIFCPVYDYSLHNRSDKTELIEPKRVIIERGRTLDSVVGQYLTTVKPMHEQFVEPSKKYADVIVPEGGNNAVALEMLATRIKEELRIM